jgi:hypothetical protein
MAYWQSLTAVFGALPVCVHLLGDSIQCMRETLWDSHFRLWYCNSHRKTTTYSLQRGALVDRRTLQVFKHDPFQTGSEYISHQGRNSKYVLKGV